MKQNKDLKKQKEEEEYKFEEEDDIEEYPVFEDDPEVWFDYLSEELATAYHVLQDWYQSQGLPILDRCTFSDFVDFCYKFSSGRKPIC
ncbi:hypothetical protein NY2A_B431L [Paramecium bursaria Chlorella virus NY2A]|uniref:Uncharacterized protein B431L n=1 Tax=Paramecium bursaria Chlorella virus NY2A TaxID=46021 RepID=A7IWV6_PBCVN|nr:hypothetical protein NY2A_B431L [Paramecium bursaria Chlorella virus NY2A]ABT14830.1 hypothetical protein NY2A_B431L [Paramecium bursaria Chlorella virus NY2A]